MMQAAFAIDVEELDIEEVKARMERGEPAATGKGASAVIVSLFSCCH